MHIRKTLLTLSALLITMLSGCGDTSRLARDGDMGPKPVIAEPNPTLIPTVKVAPIQGWPAGSAPAAAPGLAVNAYAMGLEHPRWLYVLPNGDVLVAETNAPPRPADRKGIKGWIMGIMMKRAGAGVPSANRITLLRDADGDGVAETRSVFLQNLNSPFGMTLVGSDFYVADTDAIRRFKYTPGATALDGPGAKVVDLPAGSINHHWTKNVIASMDGKRLYVTVGSNSNIAENGMDNERNRAAILEVDPATGALRLFASGLRNPNGLAWQPESGALWTAVNERDELGSDLVPDYMTSVKEGAFYGALGAHTASLGLAFYQGKLLPARYRGGAFVGQHGSWNRNPRSGYRVIFVPFASGRPAGMPEEILTGFVSADGKAYGRPVGVAVDRAGALLVADDVGNVIWRVAPAAK